MEINQYQVVLVNLYPTIGTVMKKTRPCVVLSPDEMNRHLQTIVVAPITATSKSYPTRVPIKHKKVTGWIVLDQIRSLDRRRVSKLVDTLTAKEVVKVKAVIQETYVD
jgi:mRNA interferase MazF